MYKSGNISAANSNAGVAVDRVRVMRRRLQREAEVQRTSAPISVPAGVQPYRVLHSFQFDSSALVRDHLQKINEVAQAVVDNWRAARRLLQSTLPAIPTTAGRRITTLLSVKARKQCKRRSSQPSIDVSPALFSGLASSHTVSVKRGR